MKLKRVNYISLYNQYGKTYGFNENIIIPYFDEVNNRYTDLIFKQSDDVEHIASNHVKKSPYLKKVMYTSQ